MPMLSQIAFRRTLPTSRNEAGHSRRLPLLPIALLVVATALLLTLTFRPNYYYSLDASLLVATAVEEPVKPEESSEENSAPAVIVNVTGSFDCNTVQRDDVKYFGHKECGKDMRVPNEGFMFEKRYIFSTFEKAVTKVFHDVLGSKSEQELSDGVVLDIGGNTGWFANLAAFCYDVKVHIFEPQPDCFRVICPLFRTNSVEHMITTHNNFVSNKRDMTLNMNTGAGCDPGFSPPKRSVDGGVISIAPINPTDWLGASSIPILLVKIDVEGNEVDVLNALTPLIDSKKINDIVMEVNPKHYGQNEVYQEKIEVYNREFFSQGFVGYHLEGRKTFNEFAQFAAMMKLPGTQRSGGNVHFYRR